jgi:hypothetical protein
MKKICIKGTHFDPGSERSTCRARALPGSDYCDAHLRTARVCAVRYCPDLDKHPAPLCPKHKQELADSGLEMAPWLASRPNPHAVRLESLAGFASLESVGLALFLCFFGLFLLSIFALFAGATLESPDLIVPGALAFVGFLSVVAVLVVFDPKAPKGEGDGEL